MHTNNSNSMKIDEITNQIVLLMGMGRSEFAFLFESRASEMSHGHIFTMLILTIDTSYIAFAFW